MAQNSFIKLWRSLIKWQWYDDISTCRLFIHLLLMASYEDGYSYGVEEKRGQYVTGRKKLSDETGLSEQQIRTSLNRLKSTNEITIESTNKYSVITIVKYNEYQEYGNAIVTDKSTNETTFNQPATNQQSTNNQPLPKKLRNKEIKNIRIKNIYGEFQNVKLTEEEYQKLETDNLLYMIDRLSGYIASKGDKYKSHYATIKQWVSRDEKEGKREINPRTTNTSGTRPDEKYTVGPDGVKRDKYGLEIL